MAVTASESALADGFRPPTITPPARPLGLLRMIRAAFRNPITIWPEEMYDGAVIANQLLGTTRVHVADPSAARRVLLEDAESYVRPRIVKRMLGPALGAGLFTADGEGWRRQRRIAAPSFRIQELRALTPLMSRAGAAAGERLAWRPGAAVDIMPEMIRATFDVIADATIGDDARDVFDRETFARDVDLYLNIFGQVDALDVMRAPSWVPRPWHWRARGATGRIRAAALRVVAARRAAGAAGASLVDRLINAVDPEGGAGLTDREVVDNIVTFFGAGHETTAMALTWTLSILAQQPQLQEALRAETKAVAGDAPITAAHVDALTLHDQVIKEAMRLYPPGAVVGRQVAKPTQLGQHDLKPGDEVLIAV
ncbi:MAG: cytochrome P450, partial [Neomegalonema sp.]|nr:cytochrome P450 [Neomegalonema sp.]